MDALRVEPLLTLWIPTYRRSEELNALLSNLAALGFPSIAAVIVSDNDPHGQPPVCLDCEGAGWVYRRNVSNLSAGANFLRAFEECTTPWLMIVGDDDRFQPDAPREILHHLRHQPEDVVAVKFDSSLFGSQPSCTVRNLAEYVKLLRPRHYPLALNNICLVSNWLFRLEPCRRHLAAAYLGYSSKFSHILPALTACARGDGRLVFSTEAPVQHGSAVGGWPKAATSYEMAMTVSTFSGFIDATNRSALRRLVLDPGWRRLALRCLRVGGFYGDTSHGIRPLTIHLHQALLSWRYGVLALLLLPLLLVPYSRWPAALRRQVGEPGSVDRW